MLTAGIDEAGRGPLAGPVVAAAVIIPEAKKLPKGINDSKLLTAAKREEFFEFITGELIYGIGIVSAEEIDRLNILQATFKAMYEAVEKLTQKPELCLIDGNRRNHLIKFPQKTIVQGDRKIKEISAASIVAKVTRDRIMQEYHRQYPQYNFAENKGYGTADHLEAIIKHGRSPIHRQSFAVCIKEKLF